MPRIETNLSTDSMTTLVSTIRVLTKDTTDGVLSKALLAYSVCLDAVRKGRRIIITDKEGKMEQEIHFNPLPEQKG